MKIIVTKYSYLIIFLFCGDAFAQNYSVSDSASESWNFHFQQTVISQHHGGFPALYNGINSLSSSAETNTSVTSTLFFGKRLWQNAALYFNPELTGGSGFSGTRGMAGFSNGETYRIGDPSPMIYIARIYFQQSFSIGNGELTIPSDANQLGGRIDSARISFDAGKFSLSDFFDDNSYSHDPRTQFLNWSLMSNGAWDYPANTKGYTWGLVTELIQKKWALRFAAVLVPTSANGSTMDLNISKAHGEVIELEKNYFLCKKKGTIRLLAYDNLARMGNYDQAISDPSDSLDITQTRKYSRTKYGFGLNAEQSITDNTGIFMRAGWSDGKNETWAFTEIDQTFQIGISVSGVSWKRPNDTFGAAIVVNGISDEHKNYLAAGGYGFIIGDGKLLRYGSETIIETYYLFQLTKIIHLAPDYQFVMNPAYNKDRGPVNIVGIRAHVEI